MYFRKSTATNVIIGLLASCTITGAAQADPSYTGSVTGGFQSPVLAGNLILIDGSTAWSDNNMTAVYGISPNTDTISWGSSTTGAVPWYSYLWFIPADFTNVAPNTTFKLGSIQYLNGTSDLNTLIFGATLHLDLGLGITPKDISLSILTTQNTNISAARDADFVAFGSDTPLTFNVYESGISRADIYGQIVGDPYLDNFDVKITPGFERTGFVGTGVGSVPEPGTWAMMIGGFALVGGALRRRSVRAVLAGATL